CRPTTCTVLLKGAPLELLRRLKAVLGFALLAAWNQRLETAFLADLLTAAVAAAGEEAYLSASNPPTGGNTSTTHFPPTSSSSFSSSSPSFSVPSLAFFRAAAASSIRRSLAASCERGIPGILLSISPHCNAWDDSLIAEWLQQGFNFPHLGPQQGMLGGEAATQGRQQQEQQQGRQLRLVSSAQQEADQRQLAQLMQEQQPQLVADVAGGGAAGLPGQAAASLGAAAAEGADCGETAAAASAAAVPGAGAPLQSEPTFAGAVAADTAATAAAAAERPDGCREEAAAPTVAGECASPPAAGAAGGEGGAGGGVAAAAAEVAPPSASALQSPFASQACQGAQQQPPQQPGSGGAAAAAAGGGEQSASASATTAFAAAAGGLNTSRRQTDADGIDGPQPSEAAAHPQQQYLARQRSAALKQQAALAVLQGQRIYSQQRIFVTCMFRRSRDRHLCDPFQVKQIDYYHRSSDVPLIRYIKMCTQQGWSCPGAGCPDPFTAHESVFFFGSHKLTIFYSTLPPVQALPGEEKNQIWHWTRPIGRGREGSAACRRVPLSPDSCYLSMGRFLELSFSADGLDIFGRSLHYDHVRYFGLGRTLVCMFPERTAVYVMQLPDVVMSYSQSAQAKWLKQEAAELAAEANDAFDAIEGL
ncbi:hypothetical protein Agub_g5038, partial [Astrephomene gubernaculifera]